MATRIAMAVVVWLTVLATLTVLAPRGAATPEPHPAAARETGIRESAWAWPLTPQPQVERLFERPPSRYGPGHRGINLASQPGQRVLAVADGVVTHSGMVAGRGTVTVRHPNGIASTYEPLDERVTQGTAVATGDLLGVIAAGNHCADTSCLHLGARLGEDYLDPMLLLSRVRIVLLPLLES